MTLDINSLPAPIQPPKSPLDEFDPNERPQHSWATYCPGRWQTKFKLHAARGHAINALVNQRSRALYEFEGGKWVEKARFESMQFRPTTCGHCGVTTMQWLQRRDPATRQMVDITDRPKRNVVRLVFERKGGGRGKLVEPLNVLNLCPDCCRGLGYGY